MSFTSTAYVLGTTTATVGPITGRTVNIAGNLVDTPGSAWGMTNTIFSGTPTLPPVMATNLTFTGPATLGGNLTLTGNLTVSGASANLNLNGRTVAVTGTFTTQSSGILTMTNALDALIVTGNATFNGTTSNLTAGQITLQGNFSQGGNSRASRRRGRT